MTLIIAGHVIDPEGTALVGVDVLIAFDNAAAFADVAGAWDTQGRYGLSIPTDTFGAWSWPVPFSAIDPSNTTCSITLPNGVRWSGVLPLSHNGTLSLKDLKDTYSWGLVSAPSASVVAVQGPPGASGTSLPGVTSDNADGVVIAGSLTAGNINRADQGDWHYLYGSTAFVESVGNQIDVDDVVEMQANQPLVADSSVRTLTIVRSGALNGHQYLVPMVVHHDLTATTAPMEQWIKQNVIQFQIDGDGVQVHGKFKTGAAVTGSLGAATGQYWPIYDEAGTIIGGIAIQDIV